MNRLGLEGMAAQWNRQAAIKRGLIASAVGLIGAAIAARFSFAGAVGAGLGLAALVAFWLKRRTPPISAAAVAVHLNRERPALEESAALWLRDEAGLTLVERLQLQRLNAAWAEQPDRLNLGRPRAKALRPAIAGFSGAALLLLAVIVIGRTPPSALEPEDAAPVRLAPLVIDPHKQGRPVLQSASLTVIPPAYLEQAPRRIDGLDGEVAEGSTVRWELSFLGDVAALTLQGAEGQPSVTTRADGSGRFSAATNLGDTRLYQLVVTHADRSRETLPGLHTLKVIRDQAPRISWLAPTVSRSVVEPSAHPTITVNLSATDDHAVADFRLVMTVAKGSGEGVKFREREEVLPVAAGASTERRFTRTFDLAELGLEPSDELYLYAVATDSRAPSPNRARSETRFVVLRGPDTLLSDPGTAITGVNLMPQYFRSQRQLIIDTERLLAEKPTLSEEKFRQRSEDIGIDQKLLRLRYGQFLGEEFDPDSSDAAAEARGMERATNLRTGQRAEVERANAVQQAVERQHDHEPTADNRERPLTFEEIRAPFVHNHDSAETNTLFESQVKASLRDVLAAMWEAEGLLRTAQPDRALPAENRALELLKALQQADRVYVKRVGFEPSPINIADRRLKGELDNLPKSAGSPIPLAEHDASLAAINEVLRALGTTQPSNLPVAITTAVGQSLASAAQSQPERFVAALEIWQRRNQGWNEADQAALRKALWSLLPAAQEIAARPDDSAPALANRYREALAPATESSR